MTKKGELQSRQQIEALFAQRRQVATDAAKELSALGRPEKAYHETRSHFVLQVTPT